MPKHPENKAVDTDGKISRRKVLGKAALAVGGAVAAVASGVDARIALARPSDVSIDGSGKGTVNGTVLAAQTTKPKDDPRPQAPMRSKNKPCSGTGCIFNRTKPKNIKPGFPEGR